MHKQILNELLHDVIYRVRKRTIMKTEEQIHTKEVQEAHNMKNADTMRSLVLVEETLMREEVQDLIMKIDSLVILGRVLLVLML